MLLWEGGSPPWALLREGLTGCREGAAMKYWERSGFGRARSDLHTLGGCRDEQWDSLSFVVVLPSWLGVGGGATGEDSQPFPGR